MDYRELNTRDCPYSPHTILRTPSVASTPCTSRNASKSLRSPGSCNKPASTVETIQLARRFSAQATYMQIYPGANQSHPRGEGFDHPIGTSDLKRQKPMQECCHARTASFLAVPRRIELPTSRSGGRSSQKFQPLKASRWGRACRPVPLQCAWLR